MVKPTDISRFKTPSRNADGMVSDRFKRRMQGLNQSRGMYEDQLLLTEGNSLSIELYKGNPFFFHRDLAAENASPEDQQTLLRRVRRAVYNAQWVGQQQQNINAMTDAWEKANPGTAHPFYENNPEGLGTLSIDTLKENSLSLSMLFEGINFYHDHRTEIRALLKREVTMDDAFVIGQDITALRWIEALREQAAKPTVIDEEKEQKTIGQLRQSALVMPVEVQELYRKLEIPFIFQNPKASDSGRAFIANGSFSVTPSETKKVGYPLGYRFIAAHELCHQLIGHDFVRDGFKHTSSAKLAPPADVAVAAKDFQDRMDRIIARDPEMIKEWQTSYGGDMDAFENLHATLVKLRDRLQNDNIKKRYDEKGLGWEYEQVCNYYGLQQAVFADTPDTMFFVSPKAYVLSNALEANTYLQDAQLREINNYYSNPERDALFALIQADNPQIAMPAGRNK